MSLFVVCRASDEGKLGALIRDQFPQDHYALQPGQWLISANKTSQGLSEALQLSSDNFALVVSVANYWGFAEPNLWEWIKVKLEAPNGR